MTTSATTTAPYAELAAAMRGDLITSGDPGYANVLTFSYTEEEDSAVTQADIVLCTDILQREAAEQGKALKAHAAHLVVHGVMHAQGYDHETDAEATEMEAIEIEVLARLGLENPYNNS